MHGISWEIYRILMGCRRSIMHVNRVEKCDEFTAAKVEGPDILHRIYRIFTMYIKQDPFMSVYVSCMGHGMSWVYVIPSRPLCEFLG